MMAAAEGVGPMMVPTGVAEAYDGPRRGKRGGRSTTAMLYSYAEASSPENRTPGRRQPEKGIRKEGWVGVVTELRPPRLVGSHIALLSAWRGARQVKQGSLSAPQPVYPKKHGWAGTPKNSGGPDKRYPIEWDTQEGGGGRELMVAPR